MDEWWLLYFVAAVAAMGAAFRHNFKVVVKGSVATTASYWGKKLCRGTIFGDVITPLNNTVIEGDRPGQGVGHRHQ